MQSGRISRLGQLTSQGVWQIDRPKLQKRRVRLHAALFISRRYIKLKMSRTNVNNLVLNASLLKSGGPRPDRKIYAVGNGTTLRHDRIGLRRFIRNR